MLARFSWVAAVSSPRLRRLAADYEAIRSEYSGHPHVTVHPLGPLPPEAYRVEFALRGLVLQGAQPTPADRHAVEIRLPLGYPREPPLVVPLTPIFHPNVAPDHYCVADYWSAGEPLVDVIAKIGDMIQWKIYNVRSPLDATAAYWAEQNKHLFPVGNVDLHRGEVQIALRPQAADPATSDEEPLPVADEEPLVISLRKEKE